MAELTLISPRKWRLRPVVEPAIQNELRLLEAGIRRTQERLRSFETEHNLTTDGFLHRYENDELQETLDFAEWVGEYRLLGRLQDKAATLQEIQFAD